MVVIFILELLLSWRWELVSSGRLTTCTGAY
jgi:hypothetical protein